jgi:cytochrome c2
LDIDIFKLLKLQAVEVFSLLLAMRDFAAAKGMQHDADRLKDYLEENREMISIANNQLSELEQTSDVYRLGLFDTINPL